jgi:hypothetical protein
MPSSYPDVERLVAEGDLVKIGPGYSVQTETGFEAMSPYIVGLSIGRSGKPTVTASHAERLRRSGARALLLIEAASV